MLTVAGFCLIAGAIALTPRASAQINDPSGASDAAYDVKTLYCDMVGVDCAAGSASDTSTAPTDDRWNAWREKDKASFEQQHASRDAIITAREEEEKAYLRSIGLEAPSQYGKAIVVSLSRQTLYAFENGQLINSFYISSGVAQHPSPVGSFAIYSKYAVQRMKGTYADRPWDNYDLPNVQWIEYFTGPYSIHGTYWHNNFGHPMSHGCINASNTNAYWVYSWAPIGTPVIVRW